MLNFSNYSHAANDFGVMAHLYCQVGDFQNHLGDGLLGHLWQTVFTRLTRVMPAHCGWHQALDSGPWLFNKKEKVS